MIRVAAFGDIPELISVVASAHESSNYAMISELDRDALKKVLMHYINDPSSRVFVAESESGLTGVLVATCRPLYEVLSVRAVTDLIWFVQPGARADTGPKLMRAMHEWAERLPNVALVRQQTSNAIADPTRTCRLLQRVGMRQVGAVYEREMTP